jgi:hypothetical protein
MEWKHLAPVLFLAAAACGGSEEDPTAGKSDEQLQSEIEALATPKPLPNDEPPPFRLRPLKEGEVRQHVAGRPACFLIHRGVVFFATTGNRGIANVDGRTADLVATGPVGPTGGFFSAQGATISIGRVAQFAGRAAAYPPSWPVDVAVGGAKEIMPQRFEGSWTCRTRGPRLEPAQGSTSAQ